MANRGMTSAVRSKLLSGSFEYCLFVELDFDSGTVYLSNSTSNLTYDGNTYLGTGSFGGIDKVVESNIVKASQLLLSLSGVDRVFIAQLLTEEYLNREVRIYLAVFDEDSSGKFIIPDPVLLFSGYIDSPTISENPKEGTSTIGISCTNIWADYERVAGMRTSDVSQQLFYPGDKGLAVCGDRVERIWWGRLP